MLKNLENISKSLFAFGSWLGALKHDVELSEELAEAGRSLPAAVRRAQSTPASLSASTPASVVFQNGLQRTKAPRDLSF